MFEGIATFVVGFFTLFALILGAFWRGAWVASKQDSRLTAVELSQTEIKQSILAIHNMTTELALMNQSLATLNREMKEVKTEIKGITSSLHNDKELHLQCPYYPKK